MHTLRNYEYVQQKALAGSSLFKNTWLQGPWRMSRAGAGGQRPRATAFYFLWCFKDHKGVYTEPSKSQSLCKNIAFWKGKFVSYLGKVCFSFYQHCFTQIIALV